jgi:hypothetical protein
MAIPVRPSRDASEIAMHLLSMSANEQLRRLQYADKYDQLEALELAKRIDYKYNVKQRVTRFSNLHGTKAQKVLGLDLLSEEFIELLIEIDVVNDIVNADAVDKAEREKDKAQALRLRTERQGVEAQEAEFKAAAKARGQKRHARDVFAKKAKKTEAKQSIYAQEAEEATDEQVAAEEHASILAGQREEAAADGHSVISTRSLSNKFSALRTR